MIVVLLALLQRFLPKVLRLIVPFSVSLCKRTRSAAMHRGYWVVEAGRRTASSNEFAPTAVAEIE